MAVAISVSELPVADEDPSAWNVIWIAGLPCPGICLPIDGERRRSVEHKKSKGSSRDILVDNGLEPTEVSIRIRTTSGAVFRDLYEFYLKYMNPDRILSRLAIVPVAHPQLYARGIKMGYFYSAPLPKPTAESGIRPYVSEFRFKIVGPKTQISGASTSSKPKQVSGPPTPNTTSGGVVFVDRAVGLIEQSAAEGTLFFNVNTVLHQDVDGNATQTFIPRGPPSNQGTNLYTPAQLGQIAQSGDPTARFATGLFTRGAP